ncbi:MAG: hypothetical protein V7608_2587 [Hyphomicrobiales bacterium]
MGYFDDIVPPAASYVATPPGVLRITVRPSFETGATRPPQDEGVEPSPALRQLDDMPAVVGLAPPPRTRGLFDDIVAPAMRPGLPFGDSDEIVGQAPAPGKSVFFHDDDPIADNAARTRELAWHKAAIVSALSTTVPLRLQHPRPVEIAAGLMADHGMPLDEALDRATMRLHAEEGTAEAGKISDVIGNDAFDEAQRAAADGHAAKFVGRAAPPDLAQPAPGIGQGRAATKEQAEARAPITSYVGDPVKTHPNDKAGEADSAARAGELAQHRAAVENALSHTVPLRLQHPRPVEIAAGLMADHGMPLDEALDRATMRLHAEEGTAEAGKISDVIGKDALDEAQRAPAPSDLAQLTQGVGQSLAATQEQARPDGEHALGDSAPQGEGAGGETIGSEDAAPGEQRGQSRDEPASAAVEGDERAERLTFGDGDEIVARTSGEQHLLPTIERIGDGGDTQRAAHGELDPKHDEEPPDKGPLSDEIKQSDLPTAPRPKGGVFDSAAGGTAIDLFNQLAAPEHAESQALTDLVRRDPKAAAAEGALGLGLVLGIPAAGAAGLLGAGAAAATRAAAGGWSTFGVGAPIARSIGSIGRAGEEAVGITAGVPKVSISIPGSGTTRYPDIFTPKFIGEVKNVARLSFTQQLQDYVAFAQANGIKFYLYVRRTTKLTGPLNDAILSRQIKLKYIPRS